MVDRAAALPEWRANLATIAALMARAKNELLRVPGAAIPGVLAPTIFFLGLNGVFGALTQLNGFETGTYESFVVPVSMRDSSDARNTAIAAMSRGSPTENG